MQHNATTGLAYYQEGQCSSFSAHVPIPGQCAPFMSVLRFQRHAYLRISRWKATSAGSIGESIDQKVRCIKMDEAQWPLRVCATQCSPRCTPHNPPTACCSSVSENPNHLPSFNNARMTRIVGEWICHGEGEAGWR